MGRGKLSLSKLESQARFFIPEGNRVASKFLARVGQRNQIQCEGSVFRAVPEDDYHTLDRNRV